MIDTQDIEMIISLLDADKSLKEKFKSALFSTNKEPVHKVCSYCGKTEVYAKKLCRACYERMRKTGSVERKIRVCIKKNKDVVWPTIRDVIPWQEIIARKRLGDIENYVMPPDLIESVEAYIETLPDRAKGCVLGYFRDWKTYQQLGEEYGVSRERIRQIIKNAILRMDSRILTMGNAEIKKIEQRLLEEKQAEAAEKEAKAKEKYQSQLCAEAVINSNMLLREYLTSMGCSVRGFNCLMRGLGFELEFKNAWTLKVLDFLDYIDKKKQGKFTEYFWSLRNCGRKTAEELTRYFVKED